MKLSVTLIDVGWGDSILIESEDANGDSHFALVDCNDSKYEQSSYLFVKRFFERREIDFEDVKPNFEWVMLTHGHADHARGLKQMLRKFGTRNFWYPKSVPSTTYGTLLSYANRSSNVRQHQAIDSSKLLNPAIDFGGVTLEVLWPDHDAIDTRIENNNSIVLALTLGEVTFVLTGDAEAENWDVINGRLPDTVRAIQVPHHGGRNGIFDGASHTPWLDHLAPSAPRLALSSHIRPHGHPHPDVVAEIAARGLEAFRTDEHYHVTFTTDGTLGPSGTGFEVQYSHV